MPSGGQRGLGEQAEGLGDLVGAEAGQVFAVEVDGAVLGFEEAGQAAEQGGFAAGVGADDGGDLAVGDVHVEVGHDRVGVVAEGQGLGV